MPWSTPACIGLGTDGQSGASRRGRDSPHDHLVSGQRPPAHQHVRPFCAAGARCTRVKPPRRLGRADLRARTIVRSLSVMLPDPSPALVDRVVVALGPHGWLVLARSSTAPPSRPPRTRAPPSAACPKPPRPRGRTALSRGQIAGHSARVSGRRDRRLTDAGRTPSARPDRQPRPCEVPDRLSRPPALITARRGTAAAPAHGAEGRG